MLGELAAGKFLRAASMTAVIHKSGLVRLARDCLILPAASGGANLGCRELESLTTEAEESRCPGFAPFFPACLASVCP